MYKEKYQQSERDQIDPREVYIRGMNRDQRKDRFDTNKEVLGMTPSQALDNYFKDLRADPVNGDKFIKGLEAWWCKSELGGAKNENQDIKIIKSWLKPVVEKVLTDNDRQKYLRGEESDIDWSDEKNMRKYYGLVAEMERKWQGVSLLGARSAQVNLNNLNKSEIEYAEWINKMGETFGEIGDALAGFTMEASRVSMKMAKVGVPTIMVARLLLGCVPPIEATHTSNPPIVETATVNTEPTVEKTLAPGSEPTLTYEIGSGGPNSQEQNDFLISPKGKAWQEALQQYGNYWARVGLIDPGTKLNVDVIFDSSDPTNMEKMRLTFSIFGAPVYAYVKCTMNNEQEDSFWETGNRDYLLPPPEDVLKENADPFCMGQEVKKGSFAEQVGIPIGSVFANRGGEWVYLDKNTGEVVGNINPETSQWQKVNQSESLIEGNIFVDPQTEADFVNVVEAPSPIDEPEKNAKWEDEFLKQVNEKLKNYTGPSIDLVNIGFIFDTSSFGLVSENWPVIASYKFKWQGQEILTKTFVFKDKNGNLIPLSLTYTTPNSMVFDSNTLYTTPSSKKTLEIFYQWTSRVKAVIADNFIDEFLPDEKEDIDYNARTRVVVGTGTAEDIEIISRARFVIKRFQ